MSFFYRSVAASLFPSILWHANDSFVHLTFDDGPHLRATPIVLDILKSRNLKATFFLLGTNVERYADLAREIDHQGHSLGIHAVTHTSFMFGSFSWQAHQLEETKKIIHQTTGKMPRLFRPPFGRFDRKTIKAASSQGLKTVMWDVDSRDYSSDRVRPIIRRVCRQITPGSIVLFHDNDPTTPRLEHYLNPILDYLEHRNYTFSPIGL